MQIDLVKLLLDPLVTGQQPYIYIIRTKVVQVKSFQRVYCVFGEGINAEGNIVGCI